MGFCQLATIQRRRQVVLRKKESDRGRDECKEKPMMRGACDIYTVVVVVARPLYNNAQQQVAHRTLPPPGRRPLSSVHGPVGLCS